MLSGGYADPSVLPLGDGWLMYVNQSPEEGDEASAGGTVLFTSEDGQEWAPSELGVLFPGVATGRAVWMSGGVRFFYPMAEGGGAKAILSAWSADGRSFEEEAGVRWRSDEGDAGGPTLLARPDGSWRAWYHVSNPGLSDPAVERAWIGSATSLAGAAWTVDEGASLSAEAAVEGVEPESQALHPFVLDEQGLLWMFYNAHARLFVAVSEDGEIWNKLGYIAEGADLCVAEDEEGLRVWYGRYTDVTRGEVYTSRMILSAEMALAER